jgi:actin-related protein 3
MFQHFGQRLKRDLKQLVDRRLEDSALTSGSVIKVGVSWHLQFPSY